MSFMSDSKAQSRSRCFDVGGPHLPRRRPRVVVVGVDPLRVCPVEDQRARPLGIGRGEEDRHRRALGVPEQDGAAAVDRIHDRAYVVHARLEVGHAGWPVGQTGAALVEADQACDRAEPFEEVRVARLLPVLLEVGDEAGEEHEVDRPVAGHLVGDAEVAAARVADRRANRRLGRRAGARTRGGQVQARILTEDAQLELPERRPGVDAELLDERPAAALEPMQRVGLPAAAVQREHQLAAQAFAKRVLRDERLELRHQLVMAAERQLSVDAILDRRETELLEPGDLALRERLVSQLGQRLPAPERERLAQAGRPLVRIVALSRLRDQRLEPGDVDLAGRGPQEIAGRARPDPIGADQLAQCGDVPVQRGLRGSGRLVAPQRLDERSRRARPPRDAEAASRATPAAWGAPGSRRGHPRQPSADQAARTPTPGLSHALARR